MGYEEHREREREVCACELHTVHCTALHCTAYNDSSEGSKRAAMVANKEIDRSASQHSRNLCRVGL
jgi:hypothetical protein